MYLNAWDFISVIDKDTGDLKNHSEKENFEVSIWSSRLKTNKCSTAVNEKQC